MLAVFLKDYRSFFSTLLGFMIMGLFLLLSSLFLWVIPGPFNVLEQGFAELSSFFLFAPWVYLLLVPAIAMKSLAEEKKTGTLELLLIRPLGLHKLILGKWLSILAIGATALLPTLFYLMGLGDLGMEEGNYDSGMIWGGYLGILFLLSSYSAIALYCSSLNQNQVVALLLAAIGCLFFYSGWEGLASWAGSGSFAETLQWLGGETHYQQMARGVLDLRDLLFFGVITLLFLSLTYFRLKHDR